MPVSISLLPNEPIMTPRYGTPPASARLYRRRPGAYGVLLREGRVLLTLSTLEGLEWQLPGGGIDPGENPWAALRRETLEETGWVLGPLRRLGAYRRFAWLPDDGFWAEKWCHIWLARPVVWRHPPTEAGHTAEWVPADHAVERLTDPGAKAFLRGIGWR